MYSKQAKRRGVRKFLLANKIRYEEHESFVKSFLAHYGHNTESMDLERMLNLCTLYFKSLIKYVNEKRGKRISN